MQKEDPNAQARCLVIDDNYDIFSIIQAGMASRFECVYAADAFAAHELISSQTFDLVLCDIRMPHMDGFQLVEELQKKLIKVPVIFVSGLLDAESVRRAFHLGAANVIAKPIDFDELLAKAAKALELRAKRREEEPTSDQEWGYIYNLLKSHYYDIQAIVHQIQLYRIPMSVIKDELDKKERIGKCFLDDIENIKFLIKAA